MTEDKRASDVAGAKIKELRKAQGWTAKDLAARCAELGAPEINPAVIANIETGRREKQTGRRRRDLTIDELLILAYALRTSPADLVLPKPGDRLAIAPEVSAEPDGVALWFAGRYWPTGLPTVAYGRNVTHLRLYLEAWQEWDDYKSADRAATWARKAGDDTAAEGHAAVAEGHVRKLANVVDRMIDSGLPSPVLNPGVAQMMVARGWTAHPDELRVVELIDEGQGAGDGAGS